MHQIKISDENNIRILEIMNQRAKEIKKITGIDINTDGTKAILTYDSIITLLLDFYNSHP